MGCTSSKLDNEDTVRRCKDRRRLMKEAVHARHHLAAAHADYLRNLRLTGSTLSSFAAGESLSVSSTAQPLFLHHPDPPPPPRFAPSPTIASSKLPHILTPPSAAHLHPRRRKPPRLPHILSDSSVSSPPSRNPIARQNSTYSNTPSQSSSVWNWENFCPPSPPDSDYFRRRAAETNPAQHHNRHHIGGDDGEEVSSTEEEAETETETERSEYDFFNKKQGQYHQKSQYHHHHLHESRTECQIGEEDEREEVQCSEWGDHYSSSATSEDEEEDRVTRSEIGTRSNFGSSVRAQSHQQQQQGYGKWDNKPGEAGSSAASYGHGEISDMKMVVRHRDLKDIIEAIQENFDKAATAGAQVSEMLEIGRAQLDRSFGQLKRTVYHSSSVLSNLSSSWTSKPPLAVKYHLDTSTLNEHGGPKSLCSTLERLLAWEKKLYEEVKAREGVKIEHQKKLSLLQSQEYKGEDGIKIDKTKASINRLQSLIIVTSQAVSTTATAISGLRDSDLVPQLVELCHGFMYMWKSMHQYHEVQSDIVQQVRGLVSQSAKGDSTSELHRQATRDLESAVSAWHSSFCRLIKFQRDFVHSLHDWFKLTLDPVNNENINGNKQSYSDVYGFYDEWKLALDRVPDTVASEAIKSFINVVHIISAKQAEELKIKKRTETVSKELEKKATALRSIEKKFYHSYSMVGIGVPESNSGQVLDARDPLAEKKSELAACQRRVEEEMMRHCKAVEVTRAMTLNNLQTGLPGVFQALTSFSALFTQALEAVCSRSYAIKS